MPIHTLSVPANELINDPQSRSVISEILALLITPACLLTAASWIYSKPLANKHDRARIRKWISYPLHERYKLALRHSLKKTSLLYGSSHFGPVSLFRCLTIALLYPMILLAATWTVSGQASAGSIHIIPSSNSWFSRLLLIPGFIAISFCTYYLLAVINKLSKSAQRKESTNNFSKSAKFRRFRSTIQLVIARYKAYFIVSLIFVLYFAMNAYVSTLTGDSMFSFALATTTMGVLIANFLTNSLLLRMLIILTILPVSFWISYADNSYYGGSAAGIAILLTILIVLPIVNGIGDFISIGCSRLLFTYMTKSRAKYHIIASHIFLDVLIACICLASLAAASGFLLGYITELTHDSSSAIPFEWRKHIEQWTQDPFGNGLMVSLMLLSTIAPSFLHATLATSILATSLIPRIKVFLLNQLNDLDHEQAAAASNELSHLTRVTTTCALAMIITVVMIAIAILTVAAWQLIAAITRLLTQDTPANWLRELAYWAATLGEQAAR